MKNFIYISFLLLLFTACKPTSSAIITTKEVAIKKGVYSQPVAVKTETKSYQSNKKKVATTPTISQKSPNSVQKNTSGINEKNDTDIVIENEEEASYLVEQIINSAADNLGIGYRGGGTTKNGFDCSGLIYSTFKKFDITLPRSSNEMAEVGSKIDLSNAKKGDLIFFINRGQHRINHVGMVVEVNGDEVKFIHSSTQSGVVISSIKEPYYQRTFAQVNRIIQ